MNFRDLLIRELGEALPEFMNWLDEYINKISTPNMGYKGSKRRMTFTDKEFKERIKLMLEYEEKNKLISTDELVSLTGLSHNHVRSKRKYGRKQTKRNPELIQQIYKYIDEGYSQRKVIRELNVSGPFIRTLLAERELGRSND